jgi:hypothetical protein
MHTIYTSSAHMRGCLSSSKRLPWLSIPIFNSSKNLSVIPDKRFSRFRWLQYLSFTAVLISSPATFLASYSSVNARMAHGNRRRSRQNTNRCRPPAGPPMLHWDPLMNSLDTLQYPPLKPTPDVTNAPVNFHSSVSVECSLNQGCGSWMQEMRIWSAEETSCLFLTLLTGSTEKTTKDSKINVD